MDAMMGTFAEKMSESLRYSMVHERKKGNKEETTF